MTTAMDILRQQAQLNRVNQRTPYGNQTWTTDAQGNYTLTTSLPQSEQRILQQQRRNANVQAGMVTGQLGRVNETLAQPMTTRGLPRLSGAGPAGAIQGQLGNAGQVQTGVSLAGLPDVTGGGDFSRDRRRVERSLMSRMAPDQQQDLRALESRLASQGLTIGSQAYNAEMDRFQRGLNDARLAVIDRAGQEQQRLFGMNSAARGQLSGERFAQGQFANAAQGQQFGQGLQAGQFANQAQQQQFGQGLASAQLNNQARQQGLQEQFALRQQPLNELNALRTGMQQQQPQFQPVQPLDVGSAYGYQGQQQALRQSQNNAMMGGLFGLGGTLIGAGAQNGWFDGLGGALGNAAGGAVDWLGNLF